MKSYRFRRAYVGTVNGTSYFVAAGAELDLNDADAAAIAAEAPGIFGKPAASEPETRALDGPPADRMLRKPPRKRGA